jgi:catechol 2,3-dioxygenase-like lactoylglutathione lyase family enzyme
MTIDNALASLAVTDLERSVAWYIKALGREPDKRPMPSVAEWAFPRGGGLQVYLLPERAGRGSCTLPVTDIDNEFARLEKAGISIVDRPQTDVVKVFMIADPDGNSIAFAEATGPDLTR